MAATLKDKKKTERETRYWLIVASKDHVKNGVKAGIAQANHGKQAPLKRMRQGDYVIYYSSKQTFGKPDKCQEFTAIGEVADDEIFEVDISETFKPFRRKTKYLKSEDVSILPLIEKLEFIPNKKNWGYTFRFGFFEINEHDFELISKEMLDQNDFR